MTAERVKELLGRYNLNKGRHEHLRVEIAETERAYERQRRDLIEAAASPRAQVISDMPRASGGSSDKVGDLAVKLGDGWAPPELNWMLRHIGDMVEEMETVRLEMKYVEGWIGALPAKERYLIERRYLTGETWTRVQDDMCEWLGHDITIRGLHLVKRSAMRLIYQMARDS